MRRRRRGGAFLVVSRLLLMAFPRAFRRSHGRDLLELYRDFDTGGRPVGGLARAWDLLRNGLAARFDGLRTDRAPDQRPRRNRSQAMDSILRDLRFGCRMLARSPLFTAVVVVSLGIGVGANTAVFGLVDAALLRPLAVPAPEELVVLGWRSPAGTELPDISTWGWYQLDDNGDGLSSSYSLPAFELVRARNDVLRNTFAFADIDRVNVAVDDVAELAGGQVVSGNYYAALGVEPRLGRLLVVDDDRADAEAAAVISHGYWERRFGGRPDVIGTGIRLNGVPFTIVGVAPAAFRGTLQVGDNPEITVPLAQRSRVAGGNRDWSRPQFWWLHVMGRLREGVTMDAAQSQLNALFHQSVEADMFAGSVPAQYTLPDVEVRPGHRGMTERRRNMQRPLMIMAAVTGLVLLIACTNVANLLFARSGTRRREIAVRRSIGASRARLVRQLLAESLALATIAGAFGVVLAVVGQRLLLDAMVSSALYVDGVRTDLRVVGFGIAVSLLTAVVFGLKPALHLSRPDLTPVLKEGSQRAGGGLRGMRWLMVAQVALSLLLLVGAGLFVRTLMNLLGEATGFDVDGVAVVRMEPALSGYDGERQVALYDELQRRLQGVPGVVSSTVTGHSPVSGRVSFTTLKVPGYVAAADERMRVYYNLAGPGFFETFKIPLRVGRGIEGRDQAGAPMIAVVNQTFVERYLGGEPPLGRRLGLGADGDPQEYEIVGVAADVKYQALGDEQYPVAHVAVAQHAGALRAMTVAVRVGADPESAIGAMRAIVRDLDPDIPLFDVRTLAEQQSQTLETERLFARLSTVLGVLALALASIGLYGILSYAVVRRTREIGVRMALGAGPTDVMKLVVREMRALGLGAVIGVGAALIATRYLESQLYGLGRNDPLAIAAATGVLLIVACAAAFLPARRASAVDPVVALRSG